MKFLRDILDKLAPSFERGGKFERLYPLYEAGDTFLYTPGETTSGNTHVRDGIDLKRMMSIVVVALVPCIYMALWNTGYQTHERIVRVLTAQGLEPTDAAAWQAAVAKVPGWQAAVMRSLGLPIDQPGNWAANVLHGALYFLPVYIVTMAVGGAWEVLFACVRRHEVNEGFLVTGMLFPLTLPATIPLWQVAVGISFGVVIGKEIFGGTGRNFLNPALTARAFLYFAYPAQISGSIWAAPRSTVEPFDALSGATALGAAAAAPTSIGDAEVRDAAVQAISNSPFDENIAGLGYSWYDCFMGWTQGSMGETSTLACLIGAVILIGTGIGSWRIMSGLLVGTAAFSMMTMGYSSTNAMFGFPFAWHLVVGGFAFGTVFMATDPVSASMTRTGQWWYGALIGAMTVLIRVVNPAFPEGIMLAILFGNVFAPLVDHFVLQANIKRRLARSAA